MKTQSRVKYKQLVKLFENMRQKQIRLLLLCILADGLNLYMLFQIQGFVDLVTGREFRESIAGFSSDCVNWVIVSDSTNYSGK